MLLMVFMPIYSDLFFGPEHSSIIGMSTFANVIASDPDMAKMLGDVPFGISFYVCLAIFVACIFVFVYSLIGLIRSARGKDTRFLSSRVKRWSMAILIAHTVLMFLVICEVAVLFTSLNFEGICVFNILFFVLLFVPYLPYIFSALISSQPKIKKAEQQFEENDKKDDKNV